ncbi:hypothetical protein CDL12_06286 [Handroanthus impetiginosus]|uniref:Knottin scorpion toxin-like domain-containing protein n=1 Tax=Handroanthus impetiginosus TaxID=429701 RepID=A0A2G9HU89_9LAMI|nr:hypothetical protein CDL12_06286 [Handroanthus impetiginosus]
MNKNCFEMSMTFMLLTLHAVNSSAANTHFPICYGKCMFLCVVFGPKLPCALQCVVRCYIKRKYSKKLYYCNLGCAAHQCAKFGNDTRKVEGCVKDCERNQCHS